jgi:hypothetical protein
MSDKLPDIDDYLANERIERERIRQENERRAKAEIVRQPYRVSSVVEHGTDNP